MHLKDTKMWSVFSSSYFVVINIITRREQKTDRRFYLALEWEDIKNS